MKRLIIYLFLIYGCSNNQDYGLVGQDVLQEISTIEDDLQSGLNLKNTSSVRSIYFLERLTGIESRVNIDDIPHYNSIIDFEKDKAEWINWISSNQNKVQIDSSSRVKEYVLLETAWMGW